MPLGRYRSRSRSVSPRKKDRRRSHRYDKSSGSSYSRSRSRSRSRSSERRFSRKRRPSRSSYTKQSSSRDRSRQKYEGRSHRRSRSRSSSSSPRRRRSRDKKDQSPTYAVESVKVLGRSFNEIPGLDFITQSGMSQRGKKERSYSPPAQRRREQKSTQDLDMRLRELEAQHTSDGPRPRPTDQPKDVQRGYYDSDKGYQADQKSPVEQKYQPPSYSKQRPMSPDDSRYREQRSEVGLRVEMRGKQSPKQRKFDPSLVVIPRRKDEGLVPIFSRPEIIIRTLEDDPELYPEKYERLAAWREKPAAGADAGNRKGDRDYGDRRREERSRKSSSLHKEKGRSPSPQHLPPRETTVTMKPFSIFEKFERSLRDDQGRRDISDRQYILQQVQQSSLPPLQPSTSTYNSTLGLDRMMGVSSDLRHDLDVRRQLLVLEEEEKQLEMRQAQLRAATSPVDRLTSSFDRREVSSERRPVRERLGDIAASRTKADESIPDFRKELDILNRMEPSNSPPKGTFFQHDDRDKRSSSPEKRLSRPERGRFTTRGAFRGSRGRGFRGNYFGRGRGFSRGFRGSFSRPFVRGVGTFRPRSSFTWKHDKFDDNGHERKKEKKSKSSDKKKSKKSSKKSPERSSKSSKRDSKNK